MPRLPIDTDAQKIGRAAASIAGTWFTKPERGLIWRPGRQDEDFGLDGELELTGVTVSGLLVKVQIKGTRNTVALVKRGAQRISMRPETMNYWAAIQLPVVVFLANVDTEEIYWTQPDPIYAAASPGVTFTLERRLNADPGGFVDMLYRLAQTPSSSAVLDHVGLFIEWWTELREPMDRYDRWTPVDGQEIPRLELLYEHVLRLRGLLGLAEEAMPPWAFWLDRSECAEHLAEGFSNDTGLVHVVVSEMFAYVEPLYIDALARAGEIANHADVIDTHPRLARLVEDGVLERPRLQALLGPDAEFAPIDHRGADHRQLTVLQTSEAQAAFEALLESKGARRLQLYPGA
jgi:hypothetical protein